ncbi:MAG: ribonuclease E inhibitor RraB [Acidimicrobiales bacterium]
MIRGRSPAYAKTYRKFPDDADGDALFQVMASGSDLDQPMDIDFAVLVPDEAAADDVAEDADAAGFSTEVSWDEEAGEWTCYCTRTMLATYDLVRTAQEELRAIAAPHGGVPDGWETAGNAPDGPSSEERREISHSERLGGRGGW